MTDEQRFYEAPAAGLCRFAPAVLRNREPIAEVLSEWLPQTGTVLEIASGTGEHVVFFGERFPKLEWHPSDVHPDALGSIRARRAAIGLPNVREPIVIDAAASDWPIDRADAVLSINMVHVSPWASALGLVAGAARVLPEGGSLILYGPWLSDRTEAAPSNVAFDADLKRRDPAWGLRNVERFAVEAAPKRFGLVEQREMPANNLMLLFRKWTG